MLIGNFYKTLVYITKVSKQKLLKPTSLSDNIVGSFIALALIFIIIYFFQYFYFLIQTSSASPS